MFTANDLDRIVEAAEPKDVHGMAPHVGRVSHTFHRATDGVITETVDVSLWIGDTLTATESSSVAEAVKTVKDFTAVTAAAFKAGKLAATPGHFDTGNIREERVSS